MLSLKREQIMMLLLLVFSCALHLVLLKLPLHREKPADKTAVIAVRLCAAGAPSQPARFKFAGASASGARPVKAGLSEAVPIATKAPAFVDQPPVASYLEPASTPGVAGDQALAGNASTGSATPAVAMAGELALGGSGAPRFKRQSLPTYPRQARLEGLGGRVVLRLTIDETGRLVEVEVVEAAAHGFTEAALRAVRQSTYYPALVDGRPVAAQAILPLRFSLDFGD